MFSFLMEPIKRELKLSDSELGFVAGPAIYILYTTLGVPIARIADRANRVVLMSVATLLWSLFTFSFVFVNSFAGLAGAQVGIGVGEAGFSAVAISLIGDYYPTSKRARAISIYMLGMPLGVSVSGFLAGWLNLFWGWRAAFATAGVTGACLAVVMWLTMREPLPQRSHAAAKTGREKSDIFTILVMVWRVKALRHLAVAQGLATIMASSQTWLPMYFVRRFGLDTGTLGNWFVAITIVGGGIGVWASGHVNFGSPSATSSQICKRIAIITAAVLPVTAIVLWSPAATVALSVMIVARGLSWFFVAPTLSLSQSLSETGTKATMASIFIVMQVLIGATLGGQLPGVLSDALSLVGASNTIALGTSLTVFAGIAIWASIHFWLASYYLHEGGSE